MHLNPSQNKTVALVLFGMVVLGAFVYLRSYASYKPATTNLQPTLAVIESANAVLPTSNLSSDEARYRNPTPAEKWRAYTTNDKTFTLEYPPGWDVDDVATSSAAPDEFGTKLEIWTIVSSSGSAQTSIGEQQSAQNMRVSGNNYPAGTILVQFLEYAAVENLEIESFFDCNTVDTCVVSEKNSAEVIRRDRTLTQNQKSINSGMLKNGKAYMTMITLYSPNAEQEALANEILERQTLR